MRIKLIKGSLGVIIGFLLISLIYYVIYKNVNNTNILAYNNLIFTNVKDEEILDIITNKTGVILFTNDKTDRNLITLLNDLDKTKKIYTFNIRDIEEVLKLDEGGSVVTVQEASKLYNDLLSVLGAYTEEYILTSEKEQVDTLKRRIISPLTLFIKNGHIMYGYYINSEDVSKEEIIDSYKKGFETIN